jgi:cysteine desulfuration protein SufE|tara:strand:- start:466 stop:870 length:405 start_codon:yes stop_codon:yes gene_type:complete
MIVEKIKVKGEEMEPLVGHDRLQYLIDIANTVPPLEPKDKTEENKIRGCVSNLWVTGEEKQDGTMYYKHDADAFITKGTAKIIVDIVNGEQKKDIAELTLESFKGLGIRELLTMQRQVGFASLIERIIRIAKYG